MANKLHLDLLNSGVDIWNNTRRNLKLKFIKDPFSLTEEEKIFLNPDLSGVMFEDITMHGIDLSDVNLQNSKFLKVNINDVMFANANLEKSVFIETIFTNCNLSNTNFSKAQLTSTYLTDCYLTNINFSESILDNSGFAKSSLHHANFKQANLFKCYSPEANLSDATFIGAKVYKSDFSQADFTRADMHRGIFIDCNFAHASLFKANLSEANLTATVFVGTNITGANMSNCRVYGMSIWNTMGTPSDQSNLIITTGNEPQITVDDLKLAQFIYLLINNNNIRDIIDSITSKVVLILGRFTEERKEVLDAIRIELRNFNFTPVLCDFDKPANKDVLGTVETLARMANFIIADLTDPSSIPLELGITIPYLNTTPILPIKLLGSAHTFTMFDDLRARYKEWVLDTYYYKDIKSLKSSLPMIIAPAIDRASYLRKH